VKLMWIPSHVGLVENELVYERARQTALEVSIFDKPLSSNDYQSLTRPALMRAWQAKWDSADTGRIAYSIFPDVTLRPCFERCAELGYTTQIYPFVICVYRRSSVP
jgi:hypothetical protein